MPDLILRELLGHPLKSDEIVELLEAYDIDVVYAFDRSHENLEDRYWASAKSAGFELRFDSQQRLDTIFCYMKSNEDVAAIDIELIGVPSYRSLDEARNATEAQGLAYVARVVNKSPRNSRSWLRVELADHSVHYEFSKGVLDRVTLMLRNGSTADRTP